jgi:hypothetical protein
MHHCPDRPRYLAHPQKERGGEERGERDRENERRGETEKVFVEERESERRGGGYL